MLEAFLVPLLWTLGFGLGALAVALAAFLLYCWMRSIASDDGEGGGGDAPVE